MVPDTNIERGVNKDTGSLREVNCEIKHRLERGMKHFL